MFILDLIIWWKLLYSSSKIYDKENQIVKETKQEIYKKIKKFLKNKGKKKKKKGDLKFKQTNSKIVKRFREIKT